MKADKPTYPNMLATSLDFQTPKNNWLTFNYIDFLQATRHHLVFLRANLTRSSSPTTATCFWSPRRSSDGRTSASGTAFFVRGLDYQGHQFSLLWYSPCPAPPKKQVANNINYPAKMREHIVKKQRTIQKTRSTKQPPFETKKGLPSLKLI